MKEIKFEKNLQYYKFCAYGFLKNLRFYEPFLLLFFLEKGIGYAQIGTLYALREILINIIEIPSGILADVFGRKKVMIFSFLAYIASFIIFYRASNFFILILAMFAYAFGDAFRTGTHKAMIFDYLHEKNWSNQKTHYYGKTRAWSQRGSAISALIAAFLVFWQGSYAPIFLFTIIPYVLDLLLMISYPASLDGVRKNSTRSLSIEFREVLSSLIVSVRKKDTLRAIANQSLYSGYYKACKDYLQPILKSLALGLPIMLYFKDQERTAIVTGITYSLLFYVTSIASSSSGNFSKRFKNLAIPLNRTLLLGLLLGLCSGVLSAAGLGALSVILYIGVYCIENLRKPMGITYVTERMNQDSLASALSVESQAETLFAAAIALLLGFASSLFGPGIALVIISLLCGGVALIVRLPKE